MNEPAPSDPAPAGKPRSDAYPNFNVIRLVAAITVVFSHAFAIAGEGQNEPLVRFLGPDNIAGAYAVFVFFIISGFLVTKSALYSASAIQFGWKRFLRLYPAAIVCTVVCALIGAFVSTDETGQYVREALRYVAVNAVFPGHIETISSVSFYVDEPQFGILLNGSIWSVRQELFCYAIMFCLVLARAVRPPVMLALLAGSVAWSLVTVETGHELVNSFRWAGPSFFAGAVLYFAQKRFGLSTAVGLLCLGGIVVAAMAGHLLATFPVLAAYPLLLLATSDKVRLPSLERVGDISYGVYLYGWPTEQVVRHFLGDQARWYSVFFLSLPIVLLLGWLSWHLLERHALRLKKWRPLAHLTDRPATSPS